MSTLKKHKIDAFFGLGTIAAPGAIDVKASDGSTQRLETKNIVIATGSDAARLPGIEIDEKTIVSSTGALSFETVPQKLVIVGAGIIGVELGSVWGRLGAAVIVVEYLDRVLPGFDGEAGKLFRRMLEKQGLGFRLGHKVTKAEQTKSGLQDLAQYRPRTSMPQLLGTRPNVKIKSQPTPAVAV
jgi:dihydrolipoamide dehydrogenase